MLKIKLLVVGKLKESSWQEAQADFIKRLSPFARIELIEVAPESTTATAGAERSMKLEGERLISRLDTDSFIVALDRLGKEIGSLDLAKLLREEGDGGRELTFIIGGAEGLDVAVLARANKKISLSKMTFTHEMARVFLLEQLYRAATILAGKTYHR
jgi:23S rRNA (pseudouridine1915-N3)-methyltransferase